MRSLRLLLTDRRAEPRDLQYTTPLCSIPAALGLALSVLCLTPALVRADDFPAQPPADLPARPLVLPKVQTRTLPNGLKVIVAESHHVPTVTMRLLVQAGSILSPADQSNLASNVAAQLTSGTQKYDSLKLREAAQDLGGSIGASAGADYATVSATGLAENFGPLTALMAETLLHPTFPESELALSKQRTLQSLPSLKQNPNFLAGEQFSKALYGGTHPYGASSANAAAIQSLTRDKLLSFYNDRYVPTGAVLIIVGDVRAETAFATAQKTLGGWKDSDKKPAAPALPPLPTSRPRHVYLINRPGSVQSNIMLGNLTTPRDTPDYYALLVANSILGGSPGDRLYTNVREQKGYAYDVHSGSSLRALAGDFSESAQTRTDVTAPALQEMLNEAERIRTTPVDGTELRNVKSYLLGNFALSLTSQAGIADRLLAMEAYHIPADFMTTFRDKINAVTAADVQRIAQKYFLPEQAQIVVVGDAEKLRDSLKAFGPVEENP